MLKVSVVTMLSMRVDLSPRLGGHTVANQPPLLSFTFILPPPAGTV